MPVTGYTDPSDASPASPPADNVAAKNEAERAKRDNKVGSRPKERSAIPDNFLSAINDLEESTDIFSNNIKFFANAAKDIQDRSDRYNRLIDSTITLQESSKTQNARLVQNIQTLQGRTLEVISQSTLRSLNTIIDKNNKFILDQDKKRAPENKTLEALFKQQKSSTTSQQSTGSGKVKDWFFNSTVEGDFIKSMVDAFSKKSNTDSTDTDPDQDTETAAEALRVPGLQPVKVMEYGDEALRQLCKLFKNCINLKPEKKPGDDCVELCDPCPDCSSKLPGMLPALMAVAVPVAIATAAAVAAVKTAKRAREKANEQTNENEQTNKNEQTNEQGNKNKVGKQKEKVKPVTEEVPAKTPAEVPAKTPADVPAKTPADVPAKTPAEVKPVGPTQNPPIGPEAPKKVPNPIETVTVTEVETTRPAEVETTRPVENTPTAKPNPRVPAQGQGELVTAGRTVTSPVDSITAGGRATQAVAVQTGSQIVSQASANSPTSTTGPNMGTSQTTAGAETTNYRFNQGGGGSITGGPGNGEGRGDSSGNSEGGKPGSSSKWTAAEKAAFAADQARVTPGGEIPGPASAKISAPTPAKTSSSANWTEAQKLKLAEQIKSGTSGETSTGKSPTTPEGAVKLPTTPEGAEKIPTATPASTGSSKFVLPESAQRFLSKLGPYASKLGIGLAAIGVYDFAKRHYIIDQELQSGKITTLEARKLHAYVNFITTASIGGATVGGIAGGAGLGSISMGTGTPVGALVGSTGGAILAGELATNIPFTNVNPAQEWVDKYVTEEDEKVEIGKPTFERTKNRIDLGSTGNAFMGQGGFAPQTEQVTDYSEPVAYTKDQYGQTVVIPEELAGDDKKKERDVFVQKSVELFKAKVSKNPNLYKDTKGASRFDVYNAEKPDTPVRAFRPGALDYRTELNNDNNNTASPSKTLDNSNINAVPNQPPVPLNPPEATDNEEAIKATQEFNKRLDRLINVLESKDKEQIGGDTNMASSNTTTINNNNTGGSSSPRDYPYESRNLTRIANQQTRLYV